MSTKAALPDLDNEIKIPQEKIKEFRENGHTLINHILSKEEVGVYEPLIVKAATKYNTERRKLTERDTYGKAFLQIMNLWRHDADVKKFVLAKRFARIAADLMGVKNVRLYHDQALFKEAGGGPTPWHIDQYYWPLDTPNTITMWMPLVDIQVEMGMLTFASGSHKKEFTFQHEISDDSEEEVSSYVKENNFAVTRAVSMHAGDATFHYGHTIHGAPGNNSKLMREVMTIIYFADGAKITEPSNKWQRNDREKWLMNGTAGKKAASELNPLLL